MFEPIFLIISGLEEILLNLFDSFKTVSWLLDPIAQIKAAILEAISLLLVCFDDFEGLLRT